MSVLPATLPAERLRGAHWASQFRSASDVVRDGGTVVGAPTFGPNGVTLDGTNDYLSYDIIPNDWNKDEFSCKFRFTPHFDYDQDDTIAFIDSTGSDRYLIYKANNANINVLVVILGGTTIGTIPSATYANYWKANEENTLVITSSSGDTDVWLNGVHVMINDVTAWTGKAPTELYVGGFNVGTSNFDGTIHELKFFSTKLTDQEALDYTARTQGNHLLDGDMEAVGTADWSDVAATLSKEAGQRTGGSGTQVLRVTKTGVPNGYAYQYSTVGGVRYAVSGWTRGNGTAYPRFAQGSGVTLWSGTTSTDWQYFSFEFTATSTYNRLYAAGGGAGDYTEFDDVDVRLDSEGPFSYVKDATVNLPMDLERGDPANVRTLDISGNDYHATFGDGSTPTTYPTKRTDRQGYDFDGGDYLDLGNVLSEASTAFTVSIWIQNEDTSDGDIFGKFGAALKFLLFNTASGELRFYTGSAGSLNNAARWTARTLGDEQHIVGVYDGTNTSLYVNAQLVAVAVTPVAPVASTDNLRIGVRSGGASFWNGRAWKAKIWDTVALTPMQIADLYVRESGGRHRL